MLFLLGVASWFSLRAFPVESCLALCFVFFNPSSNVITSPREERAGLCASRAFVCLFCTR